MTSPAGIGESPTVWHRLRAKRADETPIESSDSVTVEMEDEHMKRMPLSRHISLESEQYRSEGGNYLEEAEDEGVGQEIDSCPICFDALMDPCSLTCGHTFCELCLASVWKTEAGNWSENPRSILCPTCRNPTESFPQVNYAMR